MDEHLKALEAAYEKALKAVKRKPTGAAIKDLDAAERAVADYKARKAAETGSGEVRFKTLLGRDGVLDHLVSEGWKIGKSKLNSDKRRIGQEPDGTYSKRAVDEYARHFLERKGESAEDEKAAAEEKARLQNELLEEKRAKARRENEIAEGLWILRSEVEQHHTAKLAHLMNAFDNFVQGGKMEEAVEVLGGDKTLISEVKEKVRRDFRAMLSEYARHPKFSVPRKSMEEAERLKREVNGD